VDRKNFRRMKLLYSYDLIAKRPKANLGPNGSPRSERRHQNSSKLLLLHAL
jgi:hypothetical protein